jgi:hypothetical protein
MEKNKRNTLYWRICVTLVLLILALGYTPLFIPAGVYKPAVFGIPYSLWLGILVTAILVVLTFIGSRVHPGTDEMEDEE